MAPTNATKGIGSEGLKDSGNLAVITRK